MLNQLIRIQTRYVGKIADGCLIDGLVDIHLYMPISTGYIPSQPHMAARVGTAAQFQLGNLFTWLERLHRQRYWQSLSGYLQLQQG